MARRIRTNGRHFGHGLQRICCMLRLPIPAHILPRLALRFCRGSSGRLIRMAFLSLRSGQVGPSMQKRPTSSGWHLLQGKRGQLRRGEVRRPVLTLLTMAASDDCSSHEHRSSSGDTGLVRLSASMQGQATLPNFTRWEERATRDPDRIYMWWRDMPYNIGIATGPSKLLVIDCDTAHNVSDPQWRRVGDDVEVAARIMPRTFCVCTPSGGLHLYFRAPRDVSLGNTAGKLGHHIDTRGIGGYVVGPGSSCRAGYYTIIETAAVAELPKWILEALASPSTGVNHNKTAGVKHAVNYLLPVVQNDDVGAIRHDDETRTSRAVLISTLAAWSSR